MSRLAELEQVLPDVLGDDLLSSRTALGELTCEIRSEGIVGACRKLRDDSRTRFDQLIDLCGMDYSAWGAEGGNPWPGGRFAVVYHLMSVENNVRLRLRTDLGDNTPKTESMIEVWPGADWFEREAFDMFGIIFTGHPDLRRLLTDYGFIGHPFRKDFPLSGNVEMRYDEEQRRVIYEPVTVDDRILVPRTIREDTFNRTGNDDTVEEGGKDG